MMNQALTVHTVVVTRSSPVAASGAVRHADRRRHRARGCHRSVHHHARGRHRTVRHHARGRHSVIRSSRRGGVAVAVVDRR